MASERVQRGKGGTAKYSRNKRGCERYRNEHRREKNKMRRMTAMIKDLSPNNKMRILSEKRIKELSAIVRGY